jgi:hypothetical protein
MAGTSPLIAARNLTARQWRRARGRMRHEWKRGGEGCKDVVHFCEGVAESGKNASVNAARVVIKRVRRPLRELGGVRRDLLDQWAWNRTEWSAERELAQITQGDGPVILGPWLAEVGYEVLYWIPFLEWVRVAYQLDPSRAVAVSRGGVASWYDGVASRYVEMWDAVPPAEFARRNAARAEQKQSGRSRLDDDLIAHATRTLGLEGARVLHPSIMFRLFALFWSGHRAMGFIDAHTRFNLQRPPSVIDRTQLPAKYAAVKLYAARSMPDRPDVRRQVRRIVDELSEQMPVVLLETGLSVDDHTDYALGAHPRLVNARDLMQPTTNLAAQTQIVAGASVYVGTCGSITWLAPRLGVDTSALFADDEFLHNHLGVALRTSARLEGAGRFSPVDLRGLPSPPRT